MLCFNCGAETANPKFCSKSCAAIVNNSRPDVRRRPPEGSCAECGAVISSKRKYCTEHKFKHKLRTLDKTLNSNAGSNAEVRGMARRIYRRSGRPLTCALCDYAAHVDICHIKDIRSYPHGTSYAVINDPANLVALCKNHHWELDHDLL